MNGLRVLFVHEEQKNPAPRSLRDETRSRNLTCGVANSSTTVHVYTTSYTHDLATPGSRIHWRSGPQSATNDVGRRGATNKGLATIMVRITNQNTRKICRSKVGTHHTAETFYDVSFFFFFIFGSWKVPRIQAGLSNHGYKFNYPLLVRYYAYSKVMSCDPGSRHALRQMHQEPGPL